MPTLHWARHPALALVRPWSCIEDTGRLFSILGQSSGCRCRQRKQLHSVGDQLRHAHSSTLPQLLQEMAGYPRGAWHTTVWPLCQIPLGSQRS